MKPLKSFIVLSLLFALILPIQLNSALKDIKGLGDPDPKVRIETIYAVSKGFDLSTVPHIVKALNDKNPKVRAAAAEQLVYFNTPDAVPALTEALNDSNPDVVKYSVYALERLKAKSAVPELKKVLKHKDETIRVNTAVTLGKLGDKSGKGVLGKALKSKDYFIRLRSAIALRNSGDKSSIPQLKELLKDDDLAIRSNTARTLWELGDKSGREIILKECFAQLDHINRFNYSAILEDMTDESDMDLIMEALIQNKTGSSPFSKKFALNTLAKLKAKSAVPKICSLMNPEDMYSGHHRFLSYAMNTLAEIGDGSAVPTLKKFLDHSYPKMRLTSAWALYKITGDSKYKNFIYESLKDDFPCTRRETAWTLAKMKDKDSIPNLKKALKKETEPFTGKVIKETIEKISGEKVDWTPPKKVPVKKPEPVLTKKMKKRLQHGRQPPMFIYLRCDDNSTVDAMDTLADIVKEVGEKGGKVVYNLFVAPYASPDPEHIGLCLQYLFDRGTQLNNHSLYHNLQGLQLTAQNLEVQLEDVFGCDRWLRENIRGLDRVHNNRAGGGGGWNYNERRYISDEIHRRRWEACKSEYVGSGKELYPDEYFWPQEPTSDNLWNINSARSDLCAPPVSPENESLWETISFWSGKIGQLGVEEGVEMLKANFDYFYNHPMRPPFSFTSLHDWEFDYTDRPKAGHENQAEIIKRFFIDVLVTNKDKYPDTYVVTYHQLIQYLKHGDIEKVIAAGNGQTDPEFGKIIPEKEKEIIDEMWALSDSFIKNWSIIGPFESQDEKGPGKIYPPEEEIDLNKTYTGKGKEVTWTKHVIPREDFAINFNKLYSMGEDSGVAYAFAKLNSPGDRKVELRIGSNDGIKVWLNDKVVLDKYEKRLIKVDEDIVPVTLKKGENKILIKVEKSKEEKPHWGFCCRIIKSSVRH